MVQRTFECSPGVSNHKLGVFQCFQDRNLSQNFCKRLKQHQYLRAWNCFFSLGCDACNETLHAENGVFNSPNYPHKYPDKQYCSWKITVRQSQQVYVMFTSFSLQAENNTDVVYVYDGENATGEVLGVFYGGHPPPKDGIYSSSNHMFVLFKSDRNGSYAGFQASYHALNCSCKCFNLFVLLQFLTRFYYETEFSKELKSKNNEKCCFSENGKR